MNNIKVLIIDCAEDINYCIEMVLENCGKGYQIYCANGYEKGLEKINKTNPDIILLETGCGCGEVKEVKRKISMETNTPVITFSTKKTAGVDGVLNKPYNPDEVCKLILDNEKN